MNKPEVEALQKRRQRHLEQHTRLRTHGWQKAAYLRQAYDGNSNDEES